jgi:hypothetical protein
MDVPDLDMRQESLYLFVQTHLDENGELRPDGWTLPDEAQDAGMLRWVPGGRDGVARQHGGEGDTYWDTAAMVADCLEQAGRHNGPVALVELHDAACLLTSRSGIDELLEELTVRQLDWDALRMPARWLAVTSPERAAVKVGIIVLGFTGLDEDFDAVNLLGRHDEFTAYAVDAFTSGLADPEPALWDLAKHVHGWGRIECVDRLAGTRDPAIQDWILRDGFRNAVMDEYLAYTAATVGGLLEALRGENVDRELLTAAGDILQALIEGGPREDMDDYTDGFDACEAYLQLMQQHASTINDFLTVSDVLEYLHQDRDWDERSLWGWTATCRGAVEHTCEEILARDSWDDLIKDSLQSENLAVFFQADAAAQVRGIDTFDLHVARVERNPLGGGWFRAWQQADDQRAARLVELARERLDIAGILSGSGDELGMGPASRQHRALMWTLQGLRTHPGIGGDLLLVGLQSNVTSNRNMALQALDEWPTWLWPEGAQALVEAVQHNDVNNQVRAYAAAVLERHPAL